MLNEGHSLPLLQRDLVELIQRELDLFKGKCCLSYLVSPVKVEREGNRWFVIFNSGLRDAQPKKVQQPQDV